MVDQLNAFAGEVTRVAREVGTEGKLGDRRKFPAWPHLKDLTDTLNFMAANLTETGPRHRQGGDGGSQRRPETET